MKQNITKQQLSELSPQAREKLHEYLGIKITSTLDWPEKYFEKVLLNIGEMIEFIANKTNRAVDNLAIDAGEHQWHVYHLSKPKNKTAPELCDALWEAVKEVLEK